MFGLFDLKISETARFNRLPRHLCFIGSWLFLMPLKRAYGHDMYVQPFESYQLLKFIDFEDNRYQEHFTVNCTWPYCFFNTYLLHFIFLKSVVIFILIIFFIHLDLLSYEIFVVVCDNYSLFFWT